MPKHSIPLLVFLRKSYHDMMLIRYSVECWTFSGHVGESCISARGSVGELEFG